MQTQLITRRYDNKMISTNSINREQIILFDRMSGCAFGSLFNPVIL